MVSLFDSHTHLNDSAFAGHEADYVARAAERGVTHMAIVGSDAELNQGALDLARRFAHLYAVVGWHPESARLYTTAAEKVLRSQLAQPKTVAIGEIGLDYHWDSSPRPVQRQVFARQLALAAELHQPVVIHTREAMQDTYDILRRSAVTEFGGIMHSFNGGPEWAEKFLALGMYVSFSGVVTYKNAQDVQASAQLVPADRLLVETDAPYLAPLPHRGERNEPAFTADTAAFLAQLRDVPADTLAAQTFANTERIFRITEVPA
ncbi:TatD family hydrolase [Schleiferilactobacillus harbinensis]|uniref:YchF/TatD family DNA exonuclease n=1 Tax=Schleiferilactobacillus harbinensis TaxID=304207 RepID=A0A5P8M2R1_9LACO|nr:TatD family hydrolase [Schleiferilactobacillus harbinensis]MCT2907575.1 TatD family deoxyribonuclease [Schleiferilactobacillus harbinensis]QEU48707.1 TatD family deoxyribonuclease [Schleiferilactobacillus harbinensis]QFR22607.1 YchF/TatD family DNA exonuclease [Schleiferilactobacillus harbinensis]